MSFRVLDNLGSIYLCTYIEGNLKNSIFVGDFFGFYLFLRNAEHLYDLGGVSFAVDKNY